MRANRLALAAGIAGLTAALATAAPAVAAPVAPTGPGEVGVMLKCGFDTDAFGVTAYYTHCDPVTRVVIRVYTSPITGYEKCVGPGETYLGLTMHIMWAQYVRLC